MDFDFTDAQLDIKRTARDMLAQRSSLEHVQEAAEAGRYDDALVREQVELGWPGIAIGEEHGGLGLGLVDLVVLLEECGYAVAGSPLLSTVTAALVIDAAGSEQQRATWLPRLADGTASGALGLVGDDGDALVADAADADVVVLVQDDVARLLDAGAADVTPVRAIDLTRRYARVAGPGEPLPGDPAAGLDAARTAIAAELLGVCQRAIDITVAYVKDRKQFGRPVGSFQAVQHMAVEMLVRTEAVRSGVYWAAWAWDAGVAEAPEAALVAKAAASEAGRAVTATAIQAHGGIGFTWEAPLHWLYKRAQLDARALGDPPELRRAVAHLLAERQPAVSAR